MLDLNAVRDYLKTHGIKQRAIAKKLGVSDATMSAILAGKQEMTVNQYLGICEFIGKSPADFKQAS